MPREGKLGLEPAIVARAFTMEVGELSPVVRTAKGYHIIRVIGRRERVERTYEQTRGTVLRFAKKDRFKMLYAQYVAWLLESAQVDIDPAALEATELP